jgi:hypothetical protein
MGEDVHQLVIGGLPRRIETGVGGVERLQHAVDDGSTVVPRGRPAIIGPEPISDLIPADGGEVAPVEIVTDDAPSFVEDSAVGGHLRLGRGIGHAMGKARRGSASHDKGD